MKSVFVTLLLIFTLSACTKKSPLTEPQSTLSFSIKQVNSQNDFVSEAQQFSFEGTTDEWSGFPGDTNRLHRIARESTYSVVLENGVELNFTFVFSKWASLNNDILADDFILEAQIENESTLFADSGQRWNYKSFDQEYEIFYQNAEHFRIGFGGFDILRNSNATKVEDLNLQRVMVDGEEKIYAAFDFEFEAFGAYDEQKVYPGYIVTNGSFQGIIN